jgi:hypothetical protein
MELVPAHLCAGNCITPTNLELHMALKTEAITVESFETGESESMASLPNCTGCPSGCGIFPEEQYVNG